MLLLRKVCNKCLNYLHILCKIVCCFYAKCVISVGIYTFCVRYCAAFTQCVQLVFESASFTQSIHAIIGSFTDIAKIVVLLLQWNLWLNLSIYAVLSRIRYCRDLRVFLRKFVVVKILVMEKF